MTPTVGILGIGQMGASAAACFSRAGLRVVVWARDSEKLRRLPDELARMGRFLDEHVGPASGAPGSVELTDDLGAINARAGVVLECVAEDLGQKAELLRQLAPAAERGAVLASCTSGLSITAMGRASGVGRRLVGAHFWNPPHLMPLVEVVRGEETEEGLVETTSELLRRAGKLPVVCKDVPGFIGNRLLLALYREATHLVQSGTCSAADVDLVARLTFGLRLPAVGPCANMDLVGLPLIEQIQSYLNADLSDAKGPMPLIREMLAAGHTGMRSGRGFHEWTEESKAEILDRRDRQIVNQLRFLRETGALDPPG
jgi:3-hydroxybutyryl-CoA dehydrogenase